MIAFLATPVLVTGLPGVPGWALFRRLRAAYAALEAAGGPPAATQLVGAGPVGNRAIAGPCVSYVDAEDVQGWRQLFVRHRFGTVLDASGNCALRACECDPDLADLLNRRQGVTLARLAAEYGCTLLRISTDLVFSGAPGTGGYTEDSPVDPVTEYGKAMARSEDEIRTIHPSVQILRLSLPMDWSPGLRAGAIDWISWRFRSKLPATLYFDELRSAIHGDDILPACLGLLQAQAEPGIWHCGGPQDLSLYQIAQIINVTGRYDPAFLQGCPRHEAGPLPPRAGHVGMNTRKLTAILPPGTLRPMPFDSRLHPGEDRNWQHAFDRSVLPPELGMEELLVQGRTWASLPSGH